VGLRVDFTFGSLLGFLLGALDFVVGAILVGATVGAILTPIG